MEGVLLIDKERGISSFEVVRRVRAITRIKKVGHAGTLDPEASGLLLICLGRYTKLSSLFTNTHKVYETTFKLGESTTTDDGEGEVIARLPWAHLDRAGILQALTLFQGPIEQVPPRFSAIKVKGVRAYKLARVDVDAGLTPRAVEIREIQLLGLELPRISLRVDCSKGTYVRSLARDLGQVLGVGAFAEEIRRVSSGSFLVDNAVKSQDLELGLIRNNLLSGIEALGEMERVKISRTERDHAINGRRFLLPSFISKNAVAVFDDEPAFILGYREGYPKILRVL